MILLAAAAAALQPASNTADANDREQLRQLNSSWLKSYETRDRDMLGRVLSDNFIGLYGDAVLTRQQMLDGLASRPPTRVSWDKLRINLNGDIAVVDAISTITTLRNGSEASAKFHYVDIYSKRDRKWRAIASHVVRLDTQND
ncbi:MAG TPA: nuclear transport factor 2 family protein [Sphingomicrobium sp.]